MAVVGAAFGLVGSPSRAGTFAIAKAADSVVNTTAWVGNSSSVYGRGINGNAFTTSAITTFNGYQYTAFWSNVSNVGSLTVARRPIGGAWQSVVVPDRLAGTGVDNTLKNGPNDAHNVVSLGISQTDGSLHLSYDMHGHTLRYRVGAAGVATNPASFAWTSANAGTLFPNAERNWLVASGQTINTVTYPMFVTTPSGDLNFFYRNGSSGNGSWLAYDYNGTTRAWSNGRQIDDGAVGTYFGTVTSGDANRNNYPNGFTYDANGRLHSVFTWREGATGAANHDLMYVYSDDGGNVWRNNAGAVVASAATGQRFNLNSPGLIVRSLSESQSLMNQQGQAVDHANRIHSIGWHRDPAKPNTGGVWRPDESSYFHNWRDDLGNWHEARLPGNVGQRPKIFFDANDNAIAVYQVATGGALTGDLYIANGDLAIAVASKASNWTDWKIVASEAGNFVSETQADTELFASTGTLSVLMQESPTTTGNAGTRLRTLDFTVTPTAPTQRGFTALSGNWNNAVNWTGGAVPGLNDVVTINGGRTATVNSAVAPLDDMLIVGSAGSAGTLNIAAGGQLDLLHVGVFNSTYGGSIIVGRDGNSVGTYSQTGGDVSAWRFAVGDYASDTSGGGVSSATIAGGTLTTYELQVGFSATGSSSGSNFTVAGGAVTVNGDVVLGEFGNSASLDLTGGLLAIAGNLREGFNKTNVGTLRMNGGTLDMTGGSITLDVVTLNSGTIANLAAFNNGATIAKASAGVLTLTGANTFTNQVTISTGSIRATSNDALGSPTVGTTVFGGTLTGSLELANNVTLAEPITLAGRQPATTNAPHIVNISGNNTLAGAIGTTTGGNQYTFRSDSGTLTIAGVFTNGQSGVNDVRFLNLDGAGNGVWTTAIADSVATTNPSKTALLKTGAGTWTLSGTNTFTGSTTVRAGTLSLRPGAWSVLTNAGGLDVAGGVVAFDYAGSTSPRATIVPLLASGAMGNFAAGQIRSSIASDAIGIGWRDDALASKLTLQAALFGDFDLNGTVNFDDLLILAANYRASGAMSWTQGDTNYDGTVNFDDLLKLASNYNASMPAVTLEALSLATAVPEPSVLFLAVAIGTTLMRRR